MKKNISLFIALLLVFGAFYFYTQRDQPWYGRCAFGPASELTVEFIRLGDAIYLDRNVDGKAQADELLPKSGELDIPSNDGPSGYRVNKIGTFSPNASPQILDLNTVTGVDFPFTMNGILVLSRDRSVAETCQLFGPLAIHVFPHQKFRPEGDNLLKIGLITEDENSTLTSPFGPTAALVHSSIPSDREIYAFDSTVRPELEIVFQTTTTPMRQKLTFDGFC